MTSPNPSPRTPAEKSSNANNKVVCTPGITPKGVRVLYERLMQKHVSFVEEARALLRRQFEADLNNCVNLKNMMGMDPPLHEHLFLFNEEANKISQVIHTPVTTTKKGLSMASPKGSTKKNKNKNEKYTNDKEKDEATEIKKEVDEMMKEKAAGSNKELMRLLQLIR